MGWEKTHPKEVKVGDYVTWMPEDSIPVEMCEVLSIELDDLERCKIYTFETMSEESYWVWTPGTETDSSRSSRRIRLEANDHFYIWRGPLPESEEG
jgi:hypothetical protein